jgi:flavin reductase (DIM6/NTAB) family NADH-FMN oxidoreductase RutF
MLLDFAVLPPAERYKLLVGTVVPRPIALVSTRDAGGRHNAAPFSFFNVFSHDPAIVVLGIEQRRRDAPKDTVANIRATGEFVVNLVDEAIAAAMNVCAIDFEAGLTPAPSATVAAPRIAESPVALECRLVQELRFGEEGARSLVVGEVLAMQLRDGLLDAAGRVDTRALGLVGRFGGGGAYVHLSDPFEIPRLTAAEWFARKPR